MADVIAWGSPERQPQLTKDEVHIWRAKLGLDSISVERFSADLSADEKTRAARFVLLKDRSRFTVARGILRLLIGGYLRRPPGGLIIETGPHGKPNLRVGPDSIPLRFNLSHAHGLVLYAFSLQGEVGIDVEQIRPEAANEGIEDRYFTSQEQRELEALPPALRPEGFFSCWTRKEAYVKACGKGLQVPLDSFDVSLTPSQSATLDRVDKDRWSLYSFYPEPGFVAAMVIEGQGRRLRFWEWRDSSDEIRD